ncbi:MAG TPA: IPT/TIG domain-containing protein [Opitutaceae bacterium]|nr:IPT/TIG domain-containing protein [Opitutaceae bacterium]
MHKNHSAHARKFLTWLGAALGLILLAGCDVKIVNLTPTFLRENPSEIYTISARIENTGGNVVAGSIVPHLIIDGQDLIMKQSQGDVYTLDYQLPPGRDEFKYYILVNYKTEVNEGVPTDRETYIDYVDVKIAGRYVLSLQADRGPVGAQIGVSGSGFTPQDIVYFEGTPARTVYASPTALNFFVPAVEPDHSYKVTINGSAGSADVGTFHVDALSIQASPASLTLHTGERQPLTFTVPITAPAGGLLLDVTTDIPDSVIMPEVVVPAGSSSVTVTVQGGRAGSGSLVLKGYGAGTVAIPVTVQ